MSARTEAADGARTIPGPIGVRTCTVDAGRTVWSERSAGDHTAYVPESVLRSLESALPDSFRCLVPRVPDPRQPETAVWPGTDTSLTLFDDLAAGAARAGPSTGTLSALGRFLAGLHGTPGHDLPSGLVDRTGGAAWTDALPALAAQVRAVREPLAGAAGPAIGGALDQAPATEATALVHGRFSVALVSSGSAPALLGWREAGLGDPMTDLAHMLGELVEIAVISGDGCRARALSLAAALVKGYEHGAGRPLGTGELAVLRGATAHRVVEHMALNTVFTGDARGPARLLRACERPFAELFTTFDGGAHR